MTDRSEDGADGDRDFGGESYSRDGGDDSRDDDFDAGEDGPQTVAAASEYVREELSRFVRALRRAGVDVPANATTDAARALATVGFGDEDRARAALRACLVNRQQDLDTFDRMFAAFWRRLDAGLGPDGPADPLDAPEGGLAPLGDPADGESSDDAFEREGDDAGPDDERGATDTESVVARAAADHHGGEEDAVFARASTAGAPEPVDAPAGTDALAFDRAFDALTDALGGLRGRRWTPQGSERADARRALRSSVGTGGTVLSLPRRDRTRPEVRAVFLVDVSQSVLDTLDRGFLLDVLRRARTEWRDARVFLFDESLREVSESVGAPTRAATLDALDRASAEWGGGTRIGASLAELPADAVDGRTVAFVVSDGLETGDVGDLERELAALSSRAASVLWLNPLAASPGFEATARGMAAALPFVDGVFAFADAGDLAELARQLTRRGSGGRIGFEYDPRW
jgi:uncharacterized protein with von Willebrand factor type A (vWA) domain